MKKVLITGATRGLGKSLSNFLLEKGFYIYGTTRNLKLTQKRKQFELSYLDLSKPLSIDSYVDSLCQSSVLIDALIHNAGIAYLDPTDILGEDEVRYMFDVNFFGPVYLTKKLLPLLKKNGAGKLIFISSIVSIDPWPHLGAYSASKAALEAVAFEWAVLLKRWNISVSVIQPNPLPTDMSILRSKNAVNSPYRELTDRDLKWESIDDVCEVIFKILTHHAPQFMYQTGPHSKETADIFLKKNAKQKSLVKHQNAYYNIP